jgi:hypothetical protein
LAAYQYIPPPPNDKKRSIPTKLVIRRARVEANFAGYTDVHRSFQIKVDNEVIFSPGDVYSGHAEESFKEIEININGRPNFTFNLVMPADGWTNIQGPSQKLVVPNVADGSGGTIYGLYFITSYKNNTAPQDQLRFQGLVEYSWR